MSCSGYCCNNIYFCETPVSSLLHLIFQRYGERYTYIKAWYSSWIKLFFCNLTKLRIKDNMRRKLIIFIFWKIGLLESWNNK